MCFFVIVSRILWRRASLFCKSNFIGIIYRSFDHIKSSQFSIESLSQHDLTHSKVYEYCFYHFGRCFSQRFFLFSFENNFCSYQIITNRCDTIPNYTSQLFREDFLHCIYMLFGYFEIVLSFHIDFDSNRKSIRFKSINCSFHCSRFFFVIKLRMILAIHNQTKTTKNFVKTDWIIFFSHSFLSFVQQLLHCHQVCITATWQCIIIIIMH